VTRVLMILQIVSSIDSSPEILAQVQDVIIPIIRHTLENKILGMCRNLRNKALLAH
jgi:hypothetical protein